METLLADQIKENETAEDEDMCYKTPYELRDNYCYLTKTAAKVRRMSCMNEGNFDGEYMWLAADLYPGIGTKIQQYENQVAAFIRVTEDKQGGVSGIVSRKKGSYKKKTQLECICISKTD
jgi:hypothetical protein